MRSYCDYEECSNPDCTDLGHCNCNCHSGRTCTCGYVWPKMSKDAPAVEEAAAATVPVAAPVRPPVTKNWAEELSGYVEDVWGKIQPYVNSDELDW